MRAVSERAPLCRAQEQNVQEPLNEPFCVQERAPYADWPLEGPACSFRREIHGELNHHPEEVDAPPNHAPICVPLSNSLNRG